MVDLRPMTWEEAMRRARQLSIVFGLRYRVTGRREGDGWTYHPSHTFRGARPR